MSENGKEELYNANKNDNSSRIMFIIICILVILLGALCVYMFVFGGFKFITNNQSAEESSEAAVSTEVSGTSTPEESVPAANESSEEPVSVPVASSEAGDVSEESSEPSVSEEVSKETPEHGWVINDLGYTYLYYDFALEQFTYSQKDDSPINKYIQAVNKLDSLSGSSNFYSILVPTRVEFVTIPREIKESDNFYNGNQKKFIQTVFDGASEGIKCVNVYDTLKTKYEAGEYIYYNTDPNYTHKAAYAVYEQYCASAGITPVAESTYTESALKDSFYGKFFTATGADILYENSDTLFYYDVDFTYSSKTKAYRSSGSVERDGVIFTDVTYGYYCFLGEETGKIVVTTASKTGRNVLVIGDSSAASFLTLLVPHYDEITYINSTKYTSSILDLLSSGKYQDVVVINYNTTASRDAGVCLDKLAGIN